MRQDQRENARKVRNTHAVRDVKHFEEVRTGACGLRSSVACRCNACHRGSLLEPECWVRSKVFQSLEHRVQRVEKRLIDLRHELVCDRVLFAKFGSRGGDVDTTRELERGGSLLLLEHHDISEVCSRVVLSRGRNPGLEVVEELGIWDE